MIQRDTRKHSANVVDHFSWGPCYRSLRDYKITIMEDMASALWGRSKAGSGFW